MKVGNCERLSLWSRQERSKWPTPFLKQALLLLCKTQRHRVPIPLMPQINDKRFLAAEKLLKTSTGQAAPGHSQLFQHLHFLCKGYRYSGNAALNFSRPLLQMAFSSLTIAHPWAEKLLKRPLLCGVSCGLPHLWVVFVSRTSVQTFSHSQHGVVRRSTELCSQGQFRLLCPWRRQMARWGQKGISSLGINK